MKTIFFTVADKEHLPWAYNLKASFHKFHPDIEFKIYTGKYVDKALKQDNQFFYKQKPWIMRQLVEDYELVVGMDADSIVTGELDVILKGNYDIGVVNNFNKMDAEKFGMISVYNLHPHNYINCGLVATTNKQFVNHWWRLCSNVPLFNSFRFREQDILNLIVHFSDYLVMNFDTQGEGFYGLSSKDLWSEVVLDKDKILVEFSDDKGNILLRRPIKVIHVAGGNDPKKMEIDKYFKDDVVKYIKSLYESN